MNHLRRELAPLTDAAWEQVQEEATRCLKQNLAARKVVDVSGPVGWQTDAVTTGQVTALTEQPVPSVDAAVRTPAAFIELTTPFTMSLAELDSADRGNPAIDTDPVISAARRAALAEDAVVFGGTRSGPGILGSSPHAPIELGVGFDAYPVHVARAVATLRDGGVGGPYALVLGAQEFVGVTETSERGGFPLIEHVRTLVGGDVIWAPGLAGAILLSARGGDFVLTLGQDFSIGFAGTQGDTVSLYLQQSLAFQLLTPSASVSLVRA